jgi:hypothetical protein
MDEATLAAWRARGDHRFDPVRFRFIEAMARRAAGHQGPARALLDAKLAQAAADYRERLERARGGDDAAAASPAPATHPTAPRSALAELVDRLERHDARAGAAGPDGAPPELKSLQLFRSTWARLSTERRLMQSRDAVPDKAGPLNSQQLVHRCLHLMHEASPGYLQHFIAYVDGLLALEQMVPATPPSRADGERKPARGKAG